MMVIAGEGGDPKLQPSKDQSKLLSWDPKEVYCNPIIFKELYNKTHFSINKFGLTGPRQVSTFYTQEL